MARTLMHSLLNSVISAASTPYSVRSNGPSTLTRCQHLSCKQLSGTRASGTMRESSSSVLVMQMKWRLSAQEGILLSLSNRQTASFSEKIEILCFSVMYTPLASLVFMKEGSPSLSTYFQQRL